MSQAPANRYTGLAQAFHWLLALAIVVAFSVGFYMADLPFSPSRLKLFNYHKWLGVTILGLSALRLLWRLWRRPPHLPTHITARMPAWQHLAHHGTHHLLYLLFFAVPLLGWAYSSATGFQIVYLGLFPLPDLVGKDKALADVLKEAHGLAAYAMAALVALHVAAALKHQWIDRDGLLTRMLPGRD